MERRRAVQFASHIRWARIHPWNPCCRTHVWDEIEWEKQKRRNIGFRWCRGRVGVCRSNEGHVRVKTRFLSKTRRGVTLQRKHHTFLIPSAIFYGSNWLLFKHETIMGWKKRNSKMIKLAAASNISSRNGGCLRRLPNAEPTLYVELNKEIHSLRNIRWNSQSNRLCILYCTLSCNTTPHQTTPHVCRYASKTCSGYCHSSKAIPFCATRISFQRFITALEFGHHK